MRDSIRRDILAAIVLVGLASGLPVGAQAADAPSPQSVQTGGVNYLDAGKRSGPVVVLLHPSNKAMWSAQVTALIAAGFRVLAMDFAGLDQPGAPSGFPARIARLNSLLSDLGIARAHLVGTGGGAVLATQFAITHPDQARSLTIANSLGGLSDEAFNRVEKRLRSPQFDAMPREWRELGPTYRALDPEGAVRWLDMSAPRTPPAPQPAPAAGPAPPAVVTWSALDALKVPTEIITGDADPYTPPGILRLFVKRMKGSQGVVIPDSGHSAYWENPEMFNRALIRFLGKR
jgi:pimeloyl-ACP methyl ester carboxylesterase